MLKKRLAVFALAAMCLMLAALPQIMNKSLLFKKGTSYTVYAGSVSSNAQMIVCGEGKEFLTKLFTKEVTGESAAYDDKDAAFAEAERLDARFLPRFHHGSGSDLSNVISLADDGCAHAAHDSSDRSHLDLLFIL